MSEPYFDRHSSDVIKGAALLLMFIHHFFTFPEWYVPALSGLAHPWFAAHFSAPTRLCVGIFAFLSGYFYYFSKDKTLRHSLRKISDFLISYWAVYALLLLAAFAAAGYRPGARSLCHELFALERPVMVFCWYVVYYCTFMLVLPLLWRLLDRDAVAAIVFGVVLPVAVAQMAALRFPGNEVREIVDEFTPWFPVTVTGYLFARHDLFRRWFDAAWKEPLGKAARVAVWVLLLGLSFFARLYCSSFTVGSATFRTDAFALSFNPDMLYVPVFLYAFVNLWALLPQRKPGAVFAAVGKSSMLMWFFHCAFFNVARNVTQPILFFPRFAPLVLLWGAALCYAAARFVDIPVRRLNGWKNRILFGK